MSESKHTKGPWSPMWQNSRARNYGCVCHWEIPVCVGEGSSTGNAIAMVYMGGVGATGSTKELVEANARLIAAAPEMYEALVALKRDLETRDGVLDLSLGVIEAMEHALAKAEGRS